VGVFFTILWLAGSGRYSKTFSFYSNRVVRFDVDSQKHSNYRRQGLYLRLFSVNADCTEKALIEDILRNYSVLERPTRHHNETLPVYVKFTLQQIVDVVSWFSHLVLALYSCYFFHVCLHVFVSMAALLVPSRS